MKRLALQSAQGFPLKGKQIRGGRSLETETDDLVGDSAGYLTHHLPDAPSDMVRILSHHLDRGERDDWPSGNGVETHLPTLEIDREETLLVRSLVPGVERHAL